MEKKIRQDFGKIQLLLDQGDITTNLMSTSIYQYIAIAIAGLGIIQTLMKIDMNITILVAFLLSALILKFPVIMIWETQKYLRIRNDLVKKLRLTDEPQEYEEEAQKLQLFVDAELREDQYPWIDRTLMVLTVAVAFVLFLLAANNPINWIYLLIVILTGIYLITYNGGKMKPAGTTSKQAFGFGVISAILREKFWFLIAVILFIILALPIFTYNINEPTSNLPTKQLTFNLGHSSITIQCIKGTISDKIIIKHDLLTCIARYYGNITADTFGPINISVHRKIPDASTFTGPFELGSETNTTEWTVATLPLNSFNSYNETQFYAKIPSSDYFNFVLILPEYYISDPNLLYASTSLDLYEQLRQSSFQRLELAGVLLGIFGAIKFLQELWEKRNSTQ